MSGRSPQEILVRLLTVCFMGLAASPLPAVGGAAPVDASEWEPRPASTPQRAEAAAGGESFTGPEGANAFAAARRLPQATALPAAIREPGADRASTQIVATAPWTSLGPSPATRAGFAYSGRVTSLAIDPTTSGASTVLYLGSANGGVWKSTDNGASWAPRSDDQLAPAIGALAIDPNDHNVVYAGTGEPNQSVDSYKGSGVLKSTDGGTSWNLYGTSFFGSAASTISRIRVNPRNSLHVFAASRIGLAVSTNGGLTWSRNTGAGLPGGGTFIADDVVLDATTNPITLYVVARSQGVYRSLDGGATWTQLTVGLPLATGFAYRSRLVIAPSNANVLYLMIVDNNGRAYASGSHNGGYYTTDGGGSWSPMTSLNVNFTGFNGWYSLDLAVDPLNDNLLYGAGEDVFRTTNARGASGNWENMTTVFAVPNDGMFPYQHALAFAPGAVSPATLYVGNDGGIFRTSNPTASPSATAVTWENLNTSGLSIAQFVAGDVGRDFASAPIALGGSGTGTLRYTGGSSWSVVLGGRGCANAIDRADSSRMWAQAQNGAIYKSTNAGLSFSFNANPAASLYFAPLAIGRGAVNHLAWGGTNFVYETINGTSWYRSNSGSLAGSVSAIAIAPSNGAVIYAGTSDGRVCRTTTANNGGSSAYLSTTLLSNVWITSIWIDPTDANTAYATGGKFYVSPNGYVWKTSDGGANWSSIGTGLPIAPVNSVVSYPGATGKVLVVGTDVGVFFTTDEGAHWAALNHGLPSTAVNQLVIDDVRSTLVAFTAGRGAWALGLGSLLDVPGSDPMPHAGGLEGSRPNPFTRATTIEFSLARGGAVKLEVFNLLGQRVATLVDRDLPAGRHEARWDGRDSDGRALASAIYYVRLEAGSLRASRKVVRIE